MSVCAYIRVSTDKQTNENQRFELVNWCQKRGWVIEKWVSEDGVSGAKDYKKRKLGQLMAELNTGDTLVACEISRFGRDLMMVMEILRHLMDRHISVYTVKDNFTLSDEIQSKVIAFAFGLAAEIEHNLIRQRTKAALDRLKAMGKKLGRPKRERASYRILKGMEAEADKMLASGASKKSVCEALGISRSTLLRYLKITGKVEAIGKFQKHDLAPEELQKFADAGYTYERVARILSVSAKTIKAYADKHGIDFHPGVEGRVSASSVFEELDAKKDDILLRRAKGETFADIRKSLSVSPTLWSFWLRRAGLNEIQNIKDAREKRLEIQTLHAQGLSTRQIAVALRIRHKLVRLVVNGKDNGNDRVSVRDLTQAERAIAAQNGVRPETLCRRLRDGWTVHDAISTPPIPRDKRHR